MTREPLASIDSPNLTDFSYNAVAITFPKAFAEAFTEKILPEQGVFLSPPLYSKKRIWKESGATTHSHEHAYEQFIHDVFWNRSKQYPQKLIFIEGIVGCGKSTFIDYYLRSFCPNDEKSKELFAGKLVLNVNLRHIETISDFDDSFYICLREAIIESCFAKNFDIMAADDCKMWDPSFTWKSELHSGAAGPITAEQKRALIQQKLASISHKEWVHLALNYLSKKMEDATAVVPFRHLVICLDNLDQSPFDVQLHALKTVSLWLEQGKKIWKIFFPLWPKTFQELYPELSPLPSHLRIKLGAPLSLEVFKLRGGHAMQVIQNDGRGIDIEDPIKAHLDNDELKLFIAEALREANPKFVNMVKHLSGESIRRELLLLEWTVSSKSVHNHVLIQKDKQKIDKEGMFFAETGSAFPKLTNYCWEDSLFTGKYRYHHRDEHPLPNLFYCSSQHIDHRDMLIGFHIIQIIDKKNACSVDSLLTWLTPLGYEKEKVISALIYLKSKGLFQWRSEVKKDAFILLPDVISGFLRLVKTPCYLDNMAITTPVEKSRHEKMSETLASDNLQFLARAKTTIELLRQLRSDEQDFRTFKLSQSKKSESEWKSALYDANLTSVFCATALAYKERLEFLQNPGTYLSHLRPVDWASLLRSDIFTGIEDEEPQLRPYS